MLSCTYLDHGVYTLTSDCRLELRDVIYDDTEGKTRLSVVAIAALFDVLQDSTLQR